MILPRMAALAALAVIPGLLGAQRAEKAPPQREQLEARLRREFTRVVQQRVGLTDDQLAKLGPINRSFSEQRRTLQLRERDTRVAIQRAIRDTAGRSDSARVSGLLQQLVDIQKRRVQLVEDEQRALATIMTPVQRARYMALQEQTRRQVEQRRGRGGGGPPPGRRPPP
jgi:Spy/CpxP family protein refolding chaperone